MVIYGYVWLCMVMLPYVCVRAMGARMYVRVRASSEKIFGCWGRPIKTEQGRIKAEQGRIKAEQDRKRPFGGRVCARTFMNCEMGGQTNYDV
jgi:hypothetical protein